MNRRKPRRPSSLPYLLLNILVSALTTLLVLWLWGRIQANRLPDNSGLPSAVSAVAPAQFNDPTQAAPPPLPPLDTPAIQIENVFGAGDLKNEVVVIRNILSDEEIWLDGWLLQDEDGSRFKFQTVVLNPGAQTQVFTRAGHSSVTGLYWGLTSPVWEPGETVEIVDSQGNLRATFVVP